MTAQPKLRRWTDARDGSHWEVLFVPGVEEDPPAVRHVREGLLFRGENGAYHAPSPYGWDLENLKDADLQGLLDQARAAKAHTHAHAGWGVEADTARKEGDGQADRAPKPARRRRLRSPLPARRPAPDRRSPEKE